MKSLKCRHCKSSFRPATGRQIYCKRAACVKERRYAYWREYITQWKKKNPDYWEKYLRQWRKKNPGYFKNWRRKHPDYHRNWYKRRKLEASRSR